MMATDLHNDYVPAIDDYDMSSDQQEECIASPSNTTEEPLFQTKLIFDEGSSRNDAGLTDGILLQNKHECIGQDTSPCTISNDQSYDETDQTQSGATEYDDVQYSSSNSTSTDQHSCSINSMCNSSSSDSTDRHAKMCALDSEINQPVSSEQICFKNILESADKDLTCGSSTSCEQNLIGSATRRSSRCRKRSIPDDIVRCPNCSLSIRTCDLQSHLQTELYKLQRLTKNRRSYETTKRPSVNSSQGSSDDVLNAHTRYKQYLSIRTRRERRNRVRKKGKVPGEEEARCPVCNEEICGTQDELAEHVDQCLQQQEADGEAELDVEGEDNFEEYTWAGQTRIRATSLLEGGPAASGYAVAKTRPGDEDDNMDLDIDGDDCSVYGKVQYTEADLIPCSEEEAQEEKERRALRNAVLKGEGSRPSRFLPTDRQRWEQDGKLAGKIHNAEDKRIQKDCETESDLASQSEIIESLKAKIKEQDTQLQKIERPKCLICMDWYTKPLTSVQCWHVHCEECWLRTLGTKKLCPQCNMITSPADLHRIYL